MLDNQFIVTGASKGIGSSIARELDRRGLPVACISRSGDTSVGRGYVCDITDEEAVKEMLEAIAREGSIAGLVNNAGVHMTSPSFSLKTKEYESVMKLNATALMVVSRETYPYLKSHGGGKIINIGSFFDKLGVVDNLAYCASKAAVGAITRCLAVEWARENISVLNIAPGYVETNLNKDFLAREKVRNWLSQRIPVGGVGQAKDVARLVGALMMEDIPFLTGETIYMDGGQGMYH